MREHAKNGNIAGFKAGLPPELHQHAEEMMNDINRASKKMKEDIDDLFGETFIDTEDTMSVLEAIDAAHREAIPRSGDRKKIQFVARKDQDRKKSPVPYRQAAVQKNIDEAGLPNTSNYTPSMFKDKTSSTSPKMPKVSDYNPSMFNKSTSTTKLPNVNKYSPSMFKTEAKKPKSGWDRIWNPKTASGRKMIAASDEAQKAAEALRAAAKQKTNEAFDQLDEISKELVGQVNKKRTLMNKPSKTKKASDVLQRAVDKARENTKVGERPVNEGGLWANIWAKRKRIKAGSGERMRKPGEKGAPSAAAIKSAQEEFDYHIDEAAESGLAAKASKSGISIGTLRKVYRRGVAAWNSGHRPGTTPQQWGMARVNSYIAKGKGTYHGADKDLREDLDENYAEKNKKYHAGLSKSTAKARVAHWKKMDKLSDRDPRAYEPAPGDATAKTKPSKYTKMYHKKYGK
jgi:hypothetical protein